MEKEKPPIFVLRAFLSESFEIVTVTHYDATTQTICYTDGNSEKTVDFAKVAWLRLEKDRNSNS